MRQVVAVNRSKNVVEIEGSYYYEIYGLISISILQSRHVSDSP